MTPSELAAVLERIAGDWIFRTPATETALRESAAILRRLGDDALEWHVYANTAPGFDPLPEYRRRVLTPAEPYQEYTPKQARENLRAAGFNAPEPQEPVRDVCECPACGGAGYTTRMAHSLHCDGSCSNGLCPVPEPEQCEVCSGTGSIAGEETP